MGLFSTKYKTYVNTQVSRVVPDDGIPNAAKTGLIKAIMDDGDIPRYVMEEISSGIANRAERMFEYGQKGYVHGLPSGYAKDSSMGRAQVQAVLDVLEGASVDIDYLHAAAPNTLHIGWMKLMEQFNYQEDPNTIEHPLTGMNRPVFLKDMLIMVPRRMIDVAQSDAIAQWGPSPKGGPAPGRQGFPPGIARSIVAHSMPVYDQAASDDYVRVVWAFQDPGTYLDGIYVPGRLYEEAIDIPIEGYDEQAQYFHVRYTVRGVTKYWIYKIGSGGYPQLDVMVDAPVEQGTFFPFVYFRYNKKSTNEDKNSEEYKSSKKICRYLGMNFNQVCEAIDENPDIDDVEQAMLIFATPVNSQIQLEQRYLYEFFENMYNTAGNLTPTQTQAQIRANLTFGGEIVRNGIVIQDKKFKMAIANAGMYKRRVTGTIGEIGFVTSGFETRIIQKEFAEPETTNVYLVDQPIDVHHFRKQVSHATYEEIEIVDLKTMYYIFGNYTALGEDDKDTLLVPLDRSITTKYTAYEREIIYSRALHYVFNSRTVVATKWYQSFFFQMFILAVAIVLTVISMGADGGTTLGAALAGLTTAQIINMALLGLLKYVVTVVAVKLFVKLVGIEAAFIIAIAAALAGYAVKMDIISLPGAPMAQDLLGISSSLIKGVNTEVGNKIQDLMGEANEFSAFIDSQNEILETAQQLLENKNNLLSPYTVFGETPDDFYNRTVHSGNIGVTGFNAIQSYVDVALKLPSLDETVGETFNV